MSVCGRVSFGDSLASDNGEAGAFGQPPPGAFPKAFAGVIATFVWRLWPPPVSEGILLTLPWRGRDERSSLLGRRECNERRGGVTVSRVETVPEVRRSPHPSRILLRA